MNRLLLKHILVAAILAFSWSANAASWNKIGTSHRGSFDVMGRLACAIKIEYDDALLCFIAGTDEFTPQVVVPGLGHNADGRLPGNTTVKSIAIGSNADYETDWYTINVLMSDDTVWEATGRLDLFGTDVQRGFWKFVQRSYAKDHAGNAICVKKIITINSWNDFGDVFGLACDGKHILRKHGWHWDIHWENTGGFKDIGHMPYGTQGLTSLSNSGIVTYYGTNGISTWQNLPAPPAGITFRAVGGYLALAETPNATCIQFANCTGDTQRIWQYSTATGWAVYRQNEYTLPVPYPCPHATNCPGGGPFFRGSIVDGTGFYKGIDYKGGPWMDMPAIGRLYRYTYD